MLTIRNHYYVYHLTKVVVNLAVTFCRIKRKKNKMVNGQLIAFDANPRLELESLKEASKHFGKNE